ncbi:TonB-dependent receptor plug domain-containing protein [Sphingomonas sp. I4]
MSAANLGGVGAGNTLILINGRRIAGAAGFEGGFANLNGIPLSAIERVEISTGDRRPFTVPTRWAVSSTSS